MRESSLLYVARFKDLIFLGPQIPADSLLVQFVALFLIPVFNYNYRNKENDICIKEIAHSESSYMSVS